MRKSQLPEISIPKFMTILGQNDSAIAQINDNFVHTLENEMHEMDNVTTDTSTSISMNCYEKSDGLLTGHYLGIKEDSRKDYEV
jgi:hypothetical protein